MRPFSYVRAGDAGTAIALVRARPDSAFLAGGTTEVDLVRQDVLRPGLLVVWLSAETASAQKPGGVLQISHRDTPASMSTLEEVTISTV